MISDRVVQGVISDCVVQGVISDWAVQGVISDCVEHGVISACVVQGVISDCVVQGVISDCAVQGVISSSSGCLFVPCNAGYPSSLCYTVTKGVPTPVDWTQRMSNQVAVTHESRFRLTSSDGRVGLY